MANQVYANGMEVACKAASGKSMAAFPDTCLSPPSPPAGPVPIPYPNNAFAKDTDRGSVTVMISGDMVMLKDRSVFKTSTGNEAATKSLGMGVVTHTIQGEASFVSWSMDVKVEGMNVDRHMDQMVHNEQCSPANSPPWLYLDEMATGKADKCGDVRRKVDTKCSPSEFNAGSPTCSPGCCEAKKCVLSPKDGKPDCCDGNTKHHIVPDHCFKQPGSGGYYAGIDDMSYGKGFCICASGAFKHTKDSAGNLLEHGKMHRDFDRIEDQYRDNNNGRWTFADANAVGADVCAFHANCNKECLQQQTSTFYKSKGVGDNTLLRADSNGRRQASAGPEMGSPQANWSKRYG